MKELRDHKVYKYTNKINGKVYIGQTCRTLQERAKFNGSGYKGSRKFWNAISKYGWNNFTAEILKDNLTCEEATKIEDEYMREYNSVEEGYNTFYNSQLEFSNEYRSHMSIALKNSLNAEERKKKLSNSLKGCKNPFYGKHHSEEAKEKIREQKKGRKLSEEHREKISQSIIGEKNPFYGRHHSEEVKKKIGDKNRGKIRSEETKQKLSIAGRGRVMPKEIREKIRQTHRSKGVYNAKSVLCLETNKVYKSMSEASRETGISRDLIRFACRDPKKCIEGTHWKFAY